MTTPVYAVVPANFAIQYDGTNSADLETAIPDFTITGESGGNLSFTSGGNPDICPTGSWLIWSKETGAVYDRATDAIYAGRFQPIAVQSALASLQGVVDGLTATLEALPDAIEACGVATFAPILASQSATIAVPITPAMPDSDYTVHPPVIFGGVNLGALEVTATEVVDADTVNVTIQNTGLLSLGASVLVTVTAN